MCNTPRVTCQWKDTQVHRCQSFTKIGGPGGSERGGVKGGKGEDLQVHSCCQIPKKSPQNNVPLPPDFPVSVLPPSPSPYSPPCPTHTNWPRREQAKREKRVWNWSVTCGFSGYIPNVPGCLVNLIWYARSLIFLFLFWHSGDYYHHTYIMYFLTK